MVVYYVPDGFTPTVHPHGNSKNGRAFFPTLPSTLSAIKEQCTSGKGPKEVVSSVSGAVGGVRNASDACELPRNEQQVSYIKRKLKRTPSSSSSIPVSDELSVVMQKAYMEDKCFIREVRTLREPAIVVATDKQLNDLERFCCKESNFGVLTVDPTFSLGDFDVTVTTYRHLLLRCRRTGTYPAFIGPIMIHYRKTFSSYLFFSSTLVGLQHSLSALKSFGTDGESALIQAFQHSFPSAIHLLCSNHVRRNMKDKLHELHVPESAKATIISDIFGRQVGDCHFEGLVDAKTDSEFEDGVSALTAKWKYLDDRQDGPVGRFVSWFLTYKKDDIQRGLMWPVRQNAGLGDPPAVFTTNASESINAVLKSKVHYRKSELPVLIDKLREVIEEQDNEAERAVIGRGKYELCPKYKRLECDEQKWFLKMSVDDRKAHLHKVMEFDPSKKCCSRRLFSKEGSHFSAPSTQPTTSGHGSSKNTADNVSTETSFLGSVTSGHAAASQSSFHSDHTHTVFHGFDDQVAGSLDEPNSSFQSPEEHSNEQYAQGDSSSLFVLSVSVDELNSTTTPTEVLEAIWNKARHLLTEPNAVLPAPGCDSSSRMVKSTSGSRPHLVVRKKSGQFCCDSTCPNWRSLGICAHSVAAAEDNHNLYSFVTWFAKAKKIPNLTQLTTSQMPAGRGRKGGVPPRKIRKTVPADSRKSFSDIISPHNPDRTHSYQRNPVSICVQRPSSSMTQTKVSVAGGASVNIGPQSFTSMLPLSPPPLIHASPEGSTETSPFILTFITGNIRVCRGCRQKYAKPAMPPNNLCVRHKEWQTFGPADNRQRRFGNVYFHCNTPCIQAVWPHFHPEQLDIPPSMIVQLLPIHTEYIRQHMSGRL